MSDAREAIMKSLALPTERSEGAVGLLGRRIEVRDSPVHGSGVFATKRVRAESHIGWYKGEVITAQAADERYGESLTPSHTMLFTRSDGQVIDGARGGNHTRFLNHGCEPNCHAEEHPDGRIGIVASRDIAAGAELLIDYQLQVDDSAAPEEYECRCGAPSCRGTMVETT